MAAFSSYELINTLLAGGILGSVGQGIRTIVGLKKLDDKRTISETDISVTVDKEMFTTNRLVISIFIGFIAGALAILVKTPGDKGYSTEFIMTIIASGYAGSDFIEGLFNTYFKKDHNNYNNEQEFTRKGSFENYLGNYKKI